MKRILLIIFLISGFTLTHAQNHVKDSLRRELQTQKQDTNRVKTLAYLAYLYRAVPDTSLQLDMEALELSTSLNYKQGITYSLGDMTIAYMFKGNYPQALNCTFKALKIDEAGQDTAAIVGAYNLLGVLYREQGNDAEALNYLSKGLSIAQRGDLFLNISETYSNLHVLDSASIYARKGLDIANQGASADFMQWAYGRTAATYQDEGAYKLARTYYDSCLSTNLKNDLSPWLAYLGLASLYEKTGQLDSSLYYSRLCLSEVNHTGLYNARKKILPLLSSVFEKMHNTDSALFYTKLEKAVNDSMFSQQKLGQLQSMAFNEKMQEKEKEEAVQKAKETLRNQVIIFSLLGTLLVFGIIAFILYRNNIQKQKANRLLQQQKEEIDNKNTELEIEAALEKVRSSSLAMRQSDELKEVVKVVFEQLQHLGISFDFASIDLYTECSKDIYSYNCGWIGNELFVNSFHIPYIYHPIMNDVVEARERGIKFNVKTYTKEEINSALQYAFERTELKEQPDNTKAQMLLNEGYTIARAFGENCSVNINNWSAKGITDSEKNILLRFAKVFEQAYTRFLDLQKAEAAAREAVKQASVDRVRAEIASMRTTNDLDRIIPLVWNELTILHIPFIRCGVFIVNEEAQQTHVYLSTPEGEAIAAFQLPFNSKGLNEEMLQHWRNNEIFKDHWDAATFSEWTHSLVATGAIQPDERYSNEKPPENLYLHFVPFLQGMLYVGNTAPLSDDELSLIESLADAFSTAYARYEDFSKLEIAKQQIENTLTELKATQAQLIQSEKMASLGELTAGIAHEIQNPLNFVNNFSEVNKELLMEMKEEIDKGDLEEVKLIVDDLISNEEKISHHGKRADSIVKGMLQHSKMSTGKSELTDINALVDESLRLSYHGLRAKDKAFNSQLKTQFDESIGKVNIVPQDISRVLLNLFNNAFYAVHEKKAKLNGTFEPMVSVTTAKQNGSIILKVSDNGNGIPPNIINKIFQPFFTTKPTGQGTGLGLSLSYDIIKAHGGEIKVETKENEGSVFIVQLPFKN